MKTILNTQPLDKLFTEFAGDTRTVLHRGETAPLWSHSIYLLNDATIAVDSFYTSTPHGTPVWALNEAEAKYAVTIGYLEHGYRKDLEDTLHNLWQLWCDEDMAEYDWVQQAEQDSWDNISNWGFRLAIAQESEDEEDGDED